MIRYVNSSIFDSTCHCLINPVNCVGVMGKGLALEFRRRYPAMFTQYQKFCSNGDLTIGRVMFYAEKKYPNRPICLFPTKQNWRERSSVDILERSLAAFVKFAPEMKIDSAAFPQIGCGAGGLNFEYQVKPLFEKYFSDSKFDIDIHIDKGQMSI